MTVAASVDAAFEASLLMGQASSPDLDELTRRALKIKADNSRLFVHWRCSEAVECKAVGPATRCFCGHSYSSHAWYETASKRVRCRVDGCRCECFSYLPGRGATFLRCKCKHTHEDHRTKDGRPGPCAKCACTCFSSEWRCACGATHDEHRTTFETRADRARAGLPVEENLGGWSAEKPHLDAACGGVTRMASLLSGVEREGIGPLPITDGAAAGSGADAELRLSSTAQTFAKFDRRADGHVGRLRKLRDATSKAQEEGFRGGAGAAGGAGGAGAGRRLGGSGGVGAAGGGSHRLGGPPSPYAGAASSRPDRRRELAAEAAEARAAAALTAARAAAQSDGARAPPAPTPPAAPRAGPARSTAAAAARAPPAGRAAAPPPARRAGAAGGAKAAVRAARRERAADAAEGRAAAESHAAAPASPVARAPPSHPPSPGSASSPSKAHLEAARHAVRSAA